MNFDKKNLEKLTKLCRISCSEEEKTQLMENLPKILDYIQQLEELDTSNVSPCNHVLSDIQCPMRDDETKEGLSREEFLSNTADQIGGMVRVPPVIENS